MFNKLILPFLSEKMLSWLLFSTAEAIVKSTKTPKDDDFLDQVKNIYYQK